MKFDDDALTHKFKLKSLVMLIMLTSFTGTMAYRLTVPVIAYHARYSLNATMEVISLFFICFITLRALSSIIIGYIVERHYRLMYISSVFMCLNAVVTMAFLWSNDSFFYVFLRGVQGVLNGGSWPLIQLTLILLVSDDVRGRIMALYFIAGSLAAFMSNLVYILLWNLPLTWQLGLPSILFLLTSLFILVVINSSSPQLKLRLDTNKRLCQSKVSKVVRVVLVGAFIIAFTTCYTMGEFSYVFVTESLSVRKDVAALILGVTGIVGLAASYLISWFADRYSDLLAMSLSVSSATLGVFLLMSKDVLFSCIGLTLAAISIKSYIPLSRKIVVTHGERPSINIGIVNAFSNAGSSLGQLTLGFLYSSELRLLGLGGVDVFLSLSAFLSLIMALFLIKEL